MPRSAYAVLPPPDCPGGVPVLGAALLVALASCAGPSAPTPSAPTPAAPVPPAVAAMLDGWQLTLPVPGSKGDAAIVKPAAVPPPWLTADGSGAPGLLRAGQRRDDEELEHARTELDRQENFAAGQGPHTLTASVTVTQLPTEVPEVIIGQIHGADASARSVRAAVRRQRRDGVVVKQNQSDTAGTPPGAPHRRAARHPVRLHHQRQRRRQPELHRHLPTAAPPPGTHPVPAAFHGAPVRFQAGAYQQAPSTSGARTRRRRPVTFSSINVERKAPSA